VNPDALFTLSYGVYVIGTTDGERFNAQISNSVMQVTNTPVRLAAAVNKNALTHENLMKTGKFTVTVIGDSADLEYIGRFGFKSGRDTSKFKDIKFALAPSGCPFPEEHALAYFDLNVVDQFDVGTHTLFIGESNHFEIIGEGVPLTYSFYRERLRGKTPPTAPTYRAVAGDEVPEGFTSPGDVVEIDKTKQKYVCNICGYIYDPVKGDPQHGIPAGTAFDDIPDNWVCPVCGATKKDFSPMK
jgi:flavin reductase (DIM6/NTAB) family NADH-FMN oxidoreductase RutF/rubredoxin